MKCLGNEKEEYISNLNLEDESVLGSLVRYDILFVADIPKSDKQQMINIEIQMNDRPGYPLLKRAEYYCSRLIVRQKEYKKDTKGTFDMADAGICK